MVQEFPTVSLDFTEILFITACGAGVSAISSPVGMGPNPVEDRGQGPKAVGRPKSQGY